ncbi:Flp family type IVb pilin [Vibrio amylolyticus]|uniref:Flp family type IVb pilin n=1 Tax=Vibrio TaxID=662 RepID=UPI000C85115B|nr:Flp family type IVb pilin [Vibrio sp. 10N.261.55.A7]PMJ96397.1 hypothetical protein BCU12_04810 [Vibrio sp. 10N.261.55.A7]
MRNKLSRFFTNEHGVTSIEYGVLAAGLAAVIAVVLGDDGAFTQALTGAFETVAESIEQQTAGGSEGN